MLAEELGLDSLWVYDHLHNVPVPAHETMFECWTTLAAISQRTSRIKLGQMVGCSPYRNPAPAGQDHLQHRCDLRRSAHLGHRCRLVRARVHRLRLRLPEGFGPDPGAQGDGGKPEIFIRETDAELTAAGSRSFWGEPVESWTEGNLVGTPDQVAERIHSSASHS